MMRLLLALTFWLLTCVVVAGQDCAGRLVAVSEYEDEISGAFVLRRSFFELLEWNANSQFAGVALASPIASPRLKVSYEAERGSRSDEFNETIVLEGGKRLFKDFDPIEFFDGDKTGTGTYTVKLFSAGSLVCEESHPLWNESE
ncbi:hypothetical protein [Rhizobium sp. F40D2]|uniref:hypothetical protein n=1 Tax=Rhizobium sp. F40D2 TaxID=3453141 RepID=UPI003F2100F9